MNREHVQTIHGNLVYKHTCYIEWEYTFTHTVEGAKYENKYISSIAPKIVDGEIKEGGYLTSSRPHHNIKIIGVKQHRLCTRSGITVELY